MKEFFKDRAKFDKVFKIISFVVLVIFTVLVPVSALVAKISYNHSMELIGMYGAGSIEAKKYTVQSPLEFIYVAEYILGIFSLLCFLVYWAFRFFKFRDVKITKKKVIDAIPLFILAVFMAWTLVGCIQVTMEVDAEAQVKAAQNIEDVPENIRKIAEWGETNRHTNAKLFTWRGYDVARDGYFSFMVYATVIFNVLMLGKDSDKFKLWIMRSLLIASFIVAVCVLLSFFNRWAFYGSIYWNRAIFLNSNHYGYYLSISVMLAVMMFLLEKNIALKIIALLSVLVHFPVLVINNTFGAYLGILAGMVFTGIITIIRLVKSKYSKERIIETIAFAICLIAMIVPSCIIQSAFCTNYSSGGTKYTYARLWLNAGDKTNLYTFASFNEEEAKEANVDKNVIDKVPVKWGTQKEVLDEKGKSAVAKNFEGLFNDIGIWNNFYSGKEVDEDEHVSEKSGLGDSIAKTGSGRGDVWIKSLDLINQRPIFGWGLETTGNEYVKQYGLDEGRAHNLILQMGATCGVPGVLMYLIAVTIIFLRNLFDVKVRKLDKKVMCIVIVVFIISTIITNLIVSGFTDKLLINGFVTVFVWAIIALVVFVEKFKIRVNVWNIQTYVASSIFVSYMVSSIFGNSSLVNSPLFIIFVGILMNELMHKESVLIDDIKE